MSVAEIVKSKRKEAGLSQFQLAVKIGISPQSISKIENGHTKAPAHDTLKKLAAALNCDIREF